MLRIATLAALGLLVAAPASAESIRISTVGKSPEQLQSEVRQAAQRVCRKETDRSAYESTMRAACVRATVQDAMAQTQTAPLLTAAR